MGALKAIFYILHLCSHFLSVTACDVKYTNQPRYGYGCVASLNTEIMLQTDRPQCVWKCLKLKMCQYINHNDATGQCDLGLDKCASLVPVVGVTFSAFGPPRATCVHWGSKTEYGRLAVEVRFLDIVMSLTRITIDHTLLVGKFYPHTGVFWANNQGEEVGPVLDDIEFLTMDPSCTLTWMPNTAGRLLPAGAVIGGHLADGSTTYVSKVTRDDGWEAFGYYNTDEQLMYYNLDVPYTRTSMDILVLL